jgi:tetratricopeptide (TPR) repeat protein
MRTVAPGKLKLLFLLASVALAMHCASKRTFVPHPVSDWDVVERMGLSAPADLSTSDRAKFDRAWQSLRAGRLEVAVDDIESLSRRYQGRPELETAAGFLDLRLGKPADAERKFQDALAAEPQLGAARSGSFLVALQSGDPERAFERLNQLEQDFPQHELVERYGPTLRVNVAEARLASARSRMREKEYAEAASEYLRALEVAPQAGALYLEAAQAELRAGYSDRAASHARRAAELEPMNADAHLLLGEACYREEDLEGAAQAFASAAALRPEDQEIRTRLEAVERTLRESTLPEEFSSIATVSRLTREDLAALLYLELRDAFDTAPSGSRVIATDVAESWASEYILRTVGAGVLDVFPNHTFQPTAFVERMTLATALARAFEVLAPDAYQGARGSSGRPEFADLAPENPGYDAAALSVSLGLLEPGDAGGFEPRRLVSGPEATAAVAALKGYVTP